ncbi:MAG: CvpA family protein [Ignavibacteriales bacterium]|nr:CvpA family protein [Ignavibacteriales bacterium]
MLLDFLFAFPLIISALLGFRDGLVRKVVAIAVIIGGMFLSQLFMKDVADLLVKYISADPSSAPLTAYFFIFFTLILIQSLLYRLFALILSVVLVMFSLRGIPDRRTARDSRAYGTLISLAPLITDFATNIVPEAKESFEKISKPGGAGEQKKEGAESDNVKYLKGMQEDIKSSNKGIDSLRNVQKK